MNVRKKIFFILPLVVMLIYLLGTTALAAGSGDVAGAIEGMWTAASGQIKTVVNKVIFPAIDMVLAIFFFAKVGSAFFNYRNMDSLSGLLPPSFSPASSSR